MVAAPSEMPTPTPEEALRADLYRLLSVLLSQEPDNLTIEASGTLVGGDNELGRAIDQLAVEARHSNVEQLREEYFTLFIGLGRGVLVPYGSYYLTGFLHEKPLAKLRDDMAELGIVRGPALKEPEDHVAALMEIMAGLIDQSLVEHADLGTQRRMFERHVGNWTPHFFKDLANNEHSRFFAAVGAVGGAFVAIEEDAFRLS